MNLGQIVSMSNYSGFEKALMRVQLLKTNNVMCIAKQTCSVMKTVDFRWVSMRGGIMGFNFIAISGSQSIFFLQFWVLSP